MLKELIARTPRRLRHTAALPFILSCNAAETTAPAASMSAFEQRLEDLRETSHIAGITAVITRGQSVAWVKGFGVANRANGRVAGDTTTYHLASLTKTFASTVIMQLVEEGKVSLDDPVTKYGIQLNSPGVILVRHLLSHTSEGMPGTHFLYNGDRFGLLDSVIARGAGMSFAAALQERVIARIQLRHTAPNPRSPFFDVTGFDRSLFEANMASGYTYSGNGYSATPYPSAFTSAAGLTSSALDVAAYSMAMDRDVFMRPETKALAYAPVLTPAGETLPYGLGWFSTRYRGVRVIWHYGYWTANSSLIVKVPERDLTFIVLANTDGLSSLSPLGTGDLARSPWARAFLDSFVIGSLVPSQGP